MEFERPNVPREVHKLVVVFAQKRRLKLYGAYELLLKTGLERMKKEKRIG